MFREAKRMDVMYPMGEASVRLANGATYSVRRGQHWPASDPVVKEHPELFSDNACFGAAFSVPPPEMAIPPTAVEQATAAPGERRQVRRA